MSMGEESRRKRAEGTVRASRRELRRLARSVRAKVAVLTREVYRELMRDRRLRRAVRRLRRRTPEERRVTIDRIAREGVFEGVKVSEEARRLAGQASANRRLLSRLRELWSRRLVYRPPGIEVDTWFREVLRAGREVVGELRRLGYRGAVLEEAEAALRMIRERYDEAKEYLANVVGVDVETGRGIIYDRRAGVYYVGGEPEEEIAVEITFTFETRRGHEPMVMEGTKVALVRGMDSDMLERAVEDMMLELDEVIEEEFGPYVAEGLTIESVSYVAGRLVDRRYSFQVPRYPRNVINIEVERERKGRVMPRRRRYRFYTAV